MNLSQLTTLARRVYSAVNKLRIGGAAIKGDTHPLYRYFEHRVANQLVDRVLPRRKP